MTSRTLTRTGAYAVGIALAATLGVLALTGPSTYGQGDGPGSAYARPTAALRGQTLAVYVARHYDAREARTG